VCYCRLLAVVEGRSIRRLNGCMLDESVDVNNDFIRGNNDSVVGNNDRVFGNNVSIRGVDNLTVIGDDLTVTGDGRGGFSVTDTRTGQYFSLN